ncbi:MAG: hypothetical protein Q4C43_04460 [Prevotella sp.]|nr:hypothetical protein [Prevotella sp.]
MKSINLVTAVERTYYRNLEGMRYFGLTGVMLPVGIVWSPLTVKTPCSLVISDKNEDNNTLYTAKLVFKTCSALVDRKHYVYRCRLMDGRCRLLGTNERPFTVMSVTENMPERITDSHLNEVTISYTINRFIPFILPETL